MKFAVMQGRLVPPTDGRFQCFPRDRWRDEFSLAADAGIDAIEWIYDEYGADANPIASDDGVAAIRDLAAGTGVAVRSVCADYFMDLPFLRASDHEVDQRVRTMIWLLGRSGLLGAERVVIPFVDASRIETDRELDSVVEILERLLPVADGLGIELHLETALTPDRLASMAARLPSTLVKITYDVGNSASLGYHPDEEFGAYGSRVGSVHIKDRLVGGGTVPLGTGDADFNAVFRCLGAVAYSGDFVLQVARGTPGNEVALARSNKAFVLAQMAGVV